MIITLIAVLLLVVGIAIVAIENNTNFDIPGGVVATGVVALILGAAATLISMCMVIGTYVNYDVDYQNKIYEKDMLEYRIDHIEDDITGNELIYNDIVEFNNSLRSTKKWANNPWTSWFHNQDIAAIDYVELPTD